ncbi:MAG: hypothetical protein H5T63_09560, partial [Chloroflexi bacterium]|nr:hypothetical protein [Chloroflexota bacterium]
EDKIKVQIPEIAEISTHIEPISVASTVYDQLSDDSEIAQKVREIASSVPEVRDCHGVTVYKAEGKLFLALHCALDEQLPIAQAHDIATAIEERIKQECPEIARISVHVEPSAAETVSA